MQYKKALNIKTILFFSCLFLGYRTYTEVPFTWMKDSYAIINAPYHHIAPINGMVWSEQQIVENMYRYGNPKDATIKLIKEIFYLQADNVSFRPTILKSKPASYWKPKDIGHIMRVITAYRKDTTLTQEKDSLLTNALTDIMQPQRIAMEKTQKDITARITELKETIQDIALQNKTIDSLIRQNQRTKPITALDAEEKIATLKKLEEKREFLTGTRKVLDQELKALVYENKIIDHALQYGITALIDYVVQSLKESAPDKKQTYVSYTTEQILLTLLWKIANPHKDVPKQDFIDYFNELNAIINPTALKAWIGSEPYTKRDYEQFQKQLSTIQENTLASFVLKNYEQVILAIKGHSVWESPFPPIITGTQVTYVHPNGKKTEQFSDCVETAFRNVFNRALYNALTSTFDIQRLINGTLDIENIVLKPNKEFIAFYQKNPSVLNLEASTLYNAWAQIIENLSGVTYVEPVHLPQQERFYNIQSSLPNMLKIFNHLLFGNNSAFDQLSRENQLDMICKTLSHDNFTLSWEIADENGNKNVLTQSDYVTLRFFINDTHSFEWHIKEGHSVIPPLENPRYPYAKNIIRTLIKPYLKNKPPLSVEPYTLLAPCKPRILAKDTNVNLMFLQSLHTAQDKTKIIKALSKNFINGSSLQPVLIQLIQSLVHEKFHEDSARDAADIVWEILTNPTSPFYETASDVFNTIQDPLVNGFLISNIINDKSRYWYESALKKFEMLTDNVALSHVIMSVLNNKLITWYDLAKQKFEKLTEIKPLVYAIQTIIYNKIEPWYDLAKQKFTTISDEYAASELIEFIITKKTESWYDIAQQRLTTMTEEKYIVYNDDTDTAEEIYPLIYIFNAVMKNKLNSWDEVVKNRIETMTDEFALTEVIVSIVNNRYHTWENIALKKIETIHDKDLLSNIVNAVIKLPQGMRYFYNIWHKAALKKATGK